MTWEYEPALKLMRGNTEPNQSTSVSDVERVADILFHIVYKPEVPFNINGEVEAKFRKVCIDKAQSLLSLLRIEERVQQARRDEREKVLNEIKVNRYQIRSRTMSEVNEIVEVVAKRDYENWRKQRNYKTYTWYELSNNDLNLSPTEGKALWIKNARSFLLKLQNEYGVCRKSKDQRPPKEIISEYYLDRSPFIPDKDTQKQLIRNGFSKTEPLINM